MTAEPPDLHALSPAELGGLVRSALAQLSAGGTQESFAELLALSETLGVEIGAAARNLAATGSWSQVATVSGTSKQAAWSRWRG